VLRDEEVVLPFATPRHTTPLATGVRSTVLFTSQRALRTRGLYERYLDTLDGDHREPMRALTAGGWLPMEQALAHYSACDALSLERSVIESIGGEAGRALNQTVLAFVARLSQEAGVTPWSALVHTNRLIARTWQGSTCGIFKLGPKEARLEWIGQPLARNPYFRVAFGGFIHGILTLFAGVVFVRDIPKCCTSSALGYRLSWV
jgi:hypothetical protein